MENEFFMKISLINPTGLFPNEIELLVLPADNVLFKQGNEGAHMYVLKSGHADIVKNSRVVEKAHVGSILGEMTLLDNMPHNVTMIAVTDCKQTGGHQPKMPRKADFTNT